MTHLVPGAQPGEQQDFRRVDTLAARPSDSADQRVVELDSAPTQASAWRRQLPWMRELVLVLSVFIGYQWLRGRSPERVELAFANADLIERVQRWLFIDIELSVNRLLVETPWLADAASVWYQLGHFVVTVVVLLWLWVRHRGHYPLLRSTLGVTTLTGLAVYWVFPLAPPRFALNGAVDTMQVDPVLFAGIENVDSWANLYAAMPSIHTAWAVWCALAVVVAYNSPWRHLAWLYPAVTMFVVIGTAHHYVLDVVAGLVLGLVSYVVVREATLWRQRRVQARQLPATMG